MAKLCGYLNPREATSDDLVDKCIVMHSTRKRD